MESLHVGRTLAVSRRTLVVGAAWAVQGRVGANPAVGHAIHAVVDLQPIRRDARHAARADAMGDSSGRSVGPGRPPMAR